jgi:23S rRNA pseudouridine1911/1915/1917 synthase
VIYRARDTRPATAPVARSISTTRSAPPPSSRTARQSRTAVIPAICVPAGSSSIAATDADTAAAVCGDPAAGADAAVTAGTEARRAIPMISPIVPTIISTPMTMVAIFNARMPSPAQSRSALSHIHMPANSEPPTPSGSPGAQPPHGPIHITATAEHAGQRVDRFLADSIATISRSRVKTLIDEGRLRDDMGPVTQPSESVRAGGIYILDLPVPVPAAPRPQSIPFPILYEDPDLIVLDKPAGLVVHPAPGNLDGTLVNALLAHCGPSFTGIGAERRPGIVHRLDKDTSGVMVVAKTQLASDALTTAFAARDLDRAYTALVWGLPQPVTGDIEGAIGRDKRDRKRMAVIERGGKFALTRYRTMRAWRTSLALLECRLATGRTHQIRVHLSSKGHPVVGDPTYLRRVPAAAKSIAPPLRGQLLDFPRQALHASSLSFNHPRTARWLSFEAALPADMRTLLADIEANLSGC